MYLPTVTNYPILFPFALLYEVGVNIRNFLFDKGIKHSVSFEDKVAVICVGNIAVGGTGKTPHTEYVINLLRENGIGPVAVLSRGYKRRSKGFLLASPEVTASKLGDESYQLYHKFPDVYVAVDEKRVRGIKKLLALPEPPKVIVLDDAMQHRYVKPGLTICLTSHNRILYKDKVLPEGRLREPVRNLKRSDVVIVTKCPGELRDEETMEIMGNMPITTQPVYYSAYRYKSLVNIGSGQPVDVDPTTEVLVVAGIADPTVLQNYVQAHYRLLDVMTFSDHHHFSSKDIKHIQQRLEQLNSMGYCTRGNNSGSIIITTEKDASRLVDNPALSQELKDKIYYLPTEVYFLRDHKSKFDNMILDYVNKERSL